MARSAAKETPVAPPPRSEGPSEVVEPIEPFPDRVGEFHLIRRLSLGTSGDLFLARQESLSRDVALKLVRAEHLESAERRQRFRREIEELSRAPSPGIVPILAAGEDDGTVWVALEVVEGCTLAEALDELRARGHERNGSELLDAVRRLSARKLGRAPDTSERDPRAGSWVHQCVRIVRDLARALDHSHRRGVIHRDVKPSNVVIDVRGRAQLIDFGLDADRSAVRSGGRHRPTAPSLPYMAPERVLGRKDKIDARTDVYSLGVTLYELLSLELPFQDAEGRRTRELILAGEPLQLHELVPGIPWDVETICLVAMERSHDRRYASAEAFARDLENVLAGRPIDARRPGATLRATRWVEHHGFLSVALVILLPLLVLGPTIGLLILKSDRDQLAAANRTLVEQVEQLRVEQTNERIRSRGAREDR